MIEPKDNSEEDIKLLLNLIRQYHLENRVLLESFSKTALMQISKINPQIPTMQLAGEFNLSTSTELPFFKYIRPEIDLLGKELAS